VVILGLVSFFTDLASEMLYPIIPLFLTQTLGLGKDALGVIEGIAEGISTGLRWVGGVLSDLSGKRKPFVFWGYTVSALSKPVMGLAAGLSFLGMAIGGWGIFLAGRSSDRLGKSLRTAARDALIADATLPEFRGAAFGLHRAMDTCGAIAGPMVALLVLWLRPQTPLSFLFFMAFFPGLISSLLIVLFVHDRPRERDVEGARKKIRFRQSYSPGFWKLLGAIGLFSLGNSSDSLLIQRSVEMHFGSGLGKGVGSLTNEALFAIALFAVFNILYAVIAMPAGIVSDRMPRKYVVASGWILYAVVYAGFGFLEVTWMPWVLFGMYGIYQAMTEGVTKAMITDVVPAEQRAGAIGLMATVAGLGQLLASVAAGVLWQHAGAGWAFGIGAGFASLAAGLLLSVGEGKGS